MVEVVKQNKAVVVMVKSRKECEVECACTISSILSKVFNARLEFCHSVATNVYFIHPDDINQIAFPNAEDLHLFDMRIKATSNEQQRTVTAIVSVCGRKSLAVNQLFTHNMWSECNFTTGVHLTCK